ncbi:MAG: S8 family serine peptidase [Flavobacteriales bacterium]
MRCFFLFLLLPVVVFSQQRNEFLPQTVIVKVAEQYRPYCNQNNIVHPQFNKVSGVLDIIKIERIFPNHKPEKRDGLVDLSLIYQITYSALIHEIEASKQLVKWKGLIYAEPYVLPELAYTPNDPIISDPVKTWHLIMINAFAAWDVTKGDTNLVIGITDTGWDNTHPDLVVNAKKNYNDPINGIDDDADGYIDNFIGWDLGNNDNDPQLEGSNHGTHVSGLSAAVTDNGTGVASIGFNTKFMPLKISNSAGILTQAYQGVVYAADHGCFIINCSWGSTTPGQFQKDVIDYANINKGCLVVGACGNNGNEVLFYPAAYDGVLTVAASEENDLKKNNSNYGYYVDISAPGENMWSTIGGGTYGNNGGTSMAAPVVSGAAALVKAMNPTYSNQQVAAVLRATAFDMNPLNPTYYDKLGNGRLDVANALTAVSPQFIEMTSKAIVDNNDNLFVENDTLRITATFTNYLATLNGITVTLSSLSPYINVIDATTSLPNMNTLQVFTNSGDPFLVEVLNGAAYNESVLFKAEITNGSYTVYEYFYVLLNPDYINLAENQVSTTITSKGKIGFNDVNNSVGLGFDYDGEQMLYEAGLMIGASSSQVSDCVRGSGAQEWDFQSLENVKYNPPYVSALDLIGKMNDSAATSPMYLSIEQKSFAYPNSPNDKYVIVEYNIKNNGVSTLNDLYAGIFADWDIQDAMTNKAGFDVTRKMGYVYSLDVDTHYAAIKVLTTGSVVNYSLDNISGGAGGVDISNGYTAAEKYTTLTTNRSSAGAPSGQDVAHVVSTGGFTLNANDSVIVAFALIGGNSLADIKNSADQAQITYENFIGVNELVKDKEVYFYPNPTTGLIYISSKTIIEKVIISNAIGENIISTNSTRVNLENLNNGIYFIEVYTDKERFISKVVLNK